MKVMQLLRVFKDKSTSGHFRTLIVDWDDAVVVVVQAGVPADDQDVCQPNV